MTKTSTKTEVPTAMLVQLAKLFGTESRAARETSRSSSEWKKILKKSLRELGRYLDENVDSDELHMMMLYSGLASAEESLKEDDFWPGYVEGITRFALLLMGDYPDHRKRKPGRKKKNHYVLRQCRTLKYIQDETQRLRTLFAVSACGVPNLSRDPRDVLSDFRQAYGTQATYKQFFRWYRENYPEDYALVF